MNASGRAATLPPGPKLPKLAQAARYTFDWPRFSAAAQLKYGGTWTLRLPGFPPAVITTDRVAIRDLFTGDPLVRRHANDLLEPLFGSRSLLLLEPAEHLARRRLELGPFHEHSVRIFRDHIREQVALEVARWQPGETVEIHPVAQRITLGVILELVLGVRDSKLRDDISRVLGQIMKPQNSLGMFLPSGLSHRASWNLISRPFWSKIERLDGLLLGHISSTRQDPAIAERNDVLATLIQARDENGDGLSDAELRDDLVTLIVAGHETTSTAIAWGVELLAHHPEVVQRLRSTLADGDRTFLEATMKEVLRIRTVLPVTAARQPLDSFEVAGHKLPPKTLVLVNADGIHHDPELYPNPNEFRPERFLEHEPSGYSFLPFGGGARRCLGIPLAMLEFGLALEVISESCTIVPTGPPEQQVRVGTTQRPGRGARVQIEENHLVNSSAFAKADADKVAQL